MDWNLLGLSFITVFLAELGDKSQLAAIALSGTAKSPKAVFFGSVAALILASFIGVIVGEGTSQILPVKLTKAIAAIGFAVMAFNLLVLRGQGDESSAEAISEPVEPLD